MTSPVECEEKAAEPKPDCAGCEKAADGDCEGEAAEAGEKKCDEKSAEPTEADQGA
jgi:hypothetical protein